MPPELGIFLAVVIGYSFVIGCVGKIYLLATGEDYLPIHAFLCAAFWPVGLPIAFGICLAYGLINLITRGFK